MIWGLMGPEAIESERRSRTLWLTPAVRDFNERAVPGVGGIWYGKQLMLATLGILIAERLRKDHFSVTNIEMANAIEALACWLAFEKNKRQRDPRLRGITKLQGKTDLSFSAVRKRGFYVSQPMRMQTTETLRALGLVTSDSVRFNSYCCTEDGIKFIEMATGKFNPHHYELTNFLSRWAKGTESRINSGELIAALSPLQAMPDGANMFLMDRLMISNGQYGSRRRNALKWVGSFFKKETHVISWEEIHSKVDKDHGKDLYAGALLFNTTGAAIQLLDQVEAQIQKGGRLNLKESLCEASGIEEKIDLLRQCAELFIKNKHDPSPDQMASIFCQECNNKDNSAVLRSMVMRDGSGLRLREDVVLAGPAFRGKPIFSSRQISGDEQEPPIESGRPSIQWPEGLSYRIHNLFLLSCDLRGELDSWLNSKSLNEENIS